jgi:magnesium chelatase family protein
MVQVSRVDTAKLLKTPTTRKNYAELVANARAIQSRRFKTSSKTNASLTNKDVKNSAQLGNDAHLLLNQAANKMQLSARSYFKIIKIARTIADLEQSEPIKPIHVSEALQYRSRAA